MGEALGAQETSSNKSGSSSLNLSSGLRSLPVRLWAHEMSSNENGFSGLNPSGPRSLPAVAEALGSRDFLQQKRFFKIKAFPCPKEPSSAGGDSFEPLPSDEGSVAQKKASDLAKKHDKICFFIKEPNYLMKLLV